MIEERLKTLLRDPPIQDDGFRTELSMQIRNKARQAEKKRPLIRMLNSVIYMSVAAAVCIIVLYNLLPGWGERGAGSDSFVEERLIYEQSGKKILAIYPDPERMAGQYSGFIFSFTEPLSVFKGKQLTIQAIHLKTGASELVSSETITTSSSGYEGLQRYTTNLVVPFGGAWRLEVKVDGKFYADAVIHYAEPSWEESERFNAGTVKMIGTEERIGLVDVPFYAGQAQKAMWCIWRFPFELKESSLEIQALRKGSVEKRTLFSSKAYGIKQPFAAIGGGVRQSVNSLNFPEPGLWRILPYVNGKLLDTIVIKVQKSE
ncbi:DUF4871 domain-containing protein [Paenibacillus pasadenensis]|uniref:DUF4871 domain-containing protein n=1 Tax=Paenibacillus pasadenensis TaxID=217090 RepID=UPI00203F4073|nr:DUF4871 domain-containing protein [Paenibacillus pasadenensis]MCM3749570.1 DUF4871 domain-containing protein [Paenibacillus pasadenensis]